MVARDVHNARAFARFAQQLLYDVIVGLRPVPVMTKLPAINDVTDQIDCRSIVGSDEIEELVCLRPPAAEVNV